MASRFLANKVLWAEIQERAAAARHVDAAVAYLGRNGAKLLPLKAGDRLVVDLSLPAVRQGVTDPREIRKLVRRGVTVFTRRSLHAKFFLFDDLLVVGSANVSNNSMQVLDEAAIATADPAAVRRAKAFLAEMCVEPVRQKYLKECIAQYRPPKFKAATEPSKRARTPRPRAVGAKLWFVSGLRDREVPEKEQAMAEDVSEKARPLLKDARSEIDYVHYPSRPRFFSQIEKGAWAVCCVSGATGSKAVWAPEQVLGVDSYARGSGQRRHLLLLEMPSAAEAMSLPQFRRRIARAVRPVVSGRWWKREKASSSGEL